MHFGQVSYLNSLQSILKAESPNRSSKIYYTYNINAIFNLSVGNYNKKKIFFKFIASIFDNLLYKIMNSDRNSII